MSVGSADFFYQLCCYLACEIRQEFNVCSERMKSTQLIRDFSTLGFPLRRVEEFPLFHPNEQLHTFCGSSRELVTPSYVLPRSRCRRRLRLDIHDRASK